MIKTLAPMTAIAMALIATPAMAQTTGHVGLSYASGEELDVEAWAIEGAASFAFNDAIGAQVNGSLGNLEFEGDDADFHDLNARLFYTGGAWRIGALVGTSGVGTGGNEPSATHWGLEGAYWLDRVALSGSAIWGDAEWIISPSIDYSNYDFNADFYATDNLVFGATFGVGTLENIGGESDTTSYGLNAEWQLNAMPISLTAGYEHWEIDDTSVESEAWTIGARWNWGGALIERDRAGFRNTPEGVISRYFGH